MKTLPELAGDPAFREQWENLLKSELVQSILAGVESLFPPIIPNPADCNGSFPAIMLGQAVTAQVIFKSIRTPELFNLTGPGGDINKAQIRATLKTMGYPDKMIDESMEKLMAEHNVGSTE